MAAVEVLPHNQGSAVLFDGSASCGQRSRKTGAQSSQSLEQLNFTGSFAKSVCTLLLWVIAQGAAGAQDLETERRLEFSIREQPLDLALTAFAEQADLTLVFPGNLVQGRRSKGLEGEHTLADGARELLRGTGLIASISVGTVLSIRASDNKPQENAKVTNKKTRGLLTAAMALLAAPTASQAAAEERAPVYLEEIVVTAQRREENLQDIPLAITAIDKERLTRSGVTDPSRLEFVAPNVSYAQSGADTRLSIRGVSSTGIEINADPVIGFFVDGVYQSRTAQALAGFVDLNRVEIVRGPQGTLYGRNTTGGSVNLIANTPQEEFSYGIEGFAGNFDQIGGRGFVNVPLGERAGLRLAGLIEDRDGWAENQFRSGDTNNDEDQVFVRGTLEVALSNSADLILRANHWSQEGQGSGFNAYKIEGQQESFDGPFNRGNPFAGFSASGAGDPNGNPRDPYRFSNDIKAERDIEQTQLSAEFAFEFGSYGFKSITALNSFERFTRQDSDFSELDIFDVDVTQDVDTITQEFQLSYDDQDRLNWIVGLYYLEDEIDELFVVRNLSDSFLLPILGPFLINRDAKAETESLALYGQATYAVAPELRVTAGVRWTEDEKEIIVNNLGPAITGDETFDEVTWRLAVDYDLGDETLLYGYIATGFRSGGFNLNGAPAFDPETVTTYEAGLKHNFESGVINVAAFYNDFDDLQVNSFDPDTVSSFLRNSATAEIYGIEVEGEFRLDQYWTIAGSLSYQSAEFEDFIVDDPFQGGINLVDLSGRNLPRAPEFSGKLIISRDIPLGDLGSLQPLLQVSYFDEQFLTEFNQPLDRQGSFTKTDFRLFWRAADVPLQAELFVNNIEDEAVLISGVYGPGSGLFANYAAPRTYGLRIGYNY